MVLPEWAERAIGKHEPQAGDGSEPDPEILAWWRGCKQRFERRWTDLESESWKVPADHPCYVQLRRDLVWEPVEFVRECILETAIDLAWDKSFGRSPDKVAPAVKELDSLNEKISQAARDLATLFRQRDGIKRDYNLDDYASDYTSADSYDFWDALEEAIRLPHVRSWANVAQGEASAFLKIARTQSRTKPGWPDLLDQVTARPPRSALPGDAGDSAVMASRTNATEWSRWGRKLFGTLDDWGEPFPQRFLRGCLTHGQMATLAELALDAPANAFNTAQISSLAKTYDGPAK